MRIELKKLGDFCPKCKGVHLIGRADMFFYRGKTCPGLVCPNCNGLWAVEGNNIFEPLEEQNNE